MKSYSAAAILGLMSVSEGFALDQPQAPGATRPSTYDLLELLPSMKATCNGIPAPLPNVSGTGDGARGIECWGRYEVEGPLQNIPGDTGLLYGNAVRASFSCDGLFQASAAPAPSLQDRLKTELRMMTGLGGAASKDGDPPAPKLLCKGDFRQATAAVDARAGATQAAGAHEAAFAADDEVQEHLAVVTTMDCSAAFEEHAGGASSCWASDKNRAWSAGSSVSLTFRVFAPSTSLDAIDEAISEHVQWLGSRDIDSAVNVDGVASAGVGAGAADSDVQCEFSCDGATMQVKAACAEGFVSKCVVDLSSERYAVELAVETECIGDAKLKADGQEHTCWGALGFHGKESVNDKAASSKAEAVIGDDGYIGLETVMPIISHDWAGMRIMAAVPHYDTGASFMSA